MVTRRMFEKFRLLQKGFEFIAFWCRALINSLHFGYARAICH